jgi:opacity protein-like surface antigen
MLNAIRVAVAAVLAMGIVSVASAQARKPPQSSQQSGFDTKKLFFGGGIGFNEVSGSDKGTGYQFFGGYGFGEVGKDIYVDAEVGYMDTGKMETEVCVPFFGCAKADAKAKGLWANGVARFMVAPNIELIGRAGLDFGDDDGFMFGIGAGYHVNRNMKVRFEIVERENVSSMQFNFVYTP